MSEDQHPTATAVVSYPSAELMIRALGPQDLALRVIEGIYPNIQLGIGEQQVLIRGGANDAERSEVAEILEQLRSDAAGTDSMVSSEMIEATISQVRAMHRGYGANASTAGRHSSLKSSAAAATAGSVELILSSRGKQIRPKTLNQQRYVEEIDNNTIVFGLGPAGTGKTYLAMAKAVQALHAREVNRIILTRPAVEAGESLGFLPGTLSEKIDPYLRPLYDALHDMVDPETIPALIEAGTIEVAPLAYMRGRTLNDSFIILDEAQNTSAEQMKMFLTRLGFNSHMVITGDTSQVDLPRGTTSGLAQAVSYLEGIEDIAIVELTSKDVVRHRLVSKIVEAYELHQPEPGAGTGAGRGTARRGGPRHRGH